MTREKLQKIRRDAQSQAETPNLIGYWSRAWLRLADAADCLDGMMARCECIPVDDVNSEDNEEPRCR